jgi:hypothetical protein
MDKTRGSVHPSATSSLEAKRTTENRPNARCPSRLFPLRLSRSVVDELERGAGNAQHFLTRTMRTEVRC